MFEDGKTDLPSLNFYEPGTNNPITIEFYKPNEVYDNTYALIIIEQTKTSRLAVRIPQAVLNIAFHQGWEEPQEEHEPCVACAPEDVYMDGEITKEEYEERYGKNSEFLPYCKKCRESDWFKKLD
tara:strand:- start:53 stop:427 length:375 start_codon:yes stop_codon:yes gene_type:complete